MADTEQVNEDRLFVASCRLSKNADRCDIADDEMGAGKAEAANQPWPNHYCAAASHANGVEQVGKLGSAGVGCNQQKSAGVARGADHSALLVAWNMKGRFETETQEPDVGVDSDSLRFLVKRKDIHVTSVRNHVKGIREHIERDVGIHVRQCAREAIGERRHEFRERICSGG